MGSGMDVSVRAAPAVPPRAAPLAAFALPALTS